MLVKRGEFCFRKSSAKLGRHGAPDVVLIRRNNWKSMRNLLPLSRVRIKSFSCIFGAHETPSNNEFAINCLIVWQQTRQVVKLSNLCSAASCVFDFFRRETRVTIRQSFRLSLTLRCRKLLMFCETFLLSAWHRRRCFHEKQQSPTLLVPVLISIPFCMNFWWRGREWKVFSNPSRLWCACMHLCNSAVAAPNDELEIVFQPFLSFASPTHRRRKTSSIYEPEFDASRLAQANSFSLISVQKFPARLLMS